MKGNVFFEKNITFASIIKTDPMKTIKERLERYHLISFVKDETIEKGVFEIFTSGKQNKKEFKKNVVALRFLTNKGYRYRMLPVINDGGTNPDAFNLYFQYFTDIKVTESNNGKNIIQSALKEASRQFVSEVIIQFTKQLRSNREAYDILRATFAQGRARHIERVIFIMPNMKVLAVETKRFKITKRQIE